MSEPNMSIENTPQRLPEQEIDASVKPPDGKEGVNPIEEAEGIIPMSPEELMSSHNRIAIPDILKRRDIRERKASEAEEKFRTDLARLYVLQKIHSGINSSSLTEEGHSFRRSFPDSTQISQKYPSLSDKDKSKLRDGLGKFNEAAMAEELSALISDIRILYLDRGESEQTVEVEIQRFSKPKIKGSERPFGQLSRDGRISVLQNASELRGNLLRGNASSYLYYLGGLNEDPKEREKFTHTGETKKEAAALRRYVEASMNKSFTANLERFRQLDLLEGERMPHILHKVKQLEENFNRGGLAAKNKVIEHITEKRIELVLPHLNEIIRLRTILEKDDQIETVSNEAELPQDDPSRLLEEVDRIDQLLQFKIKGMPGTTGFEEGTVEDMQAVVEGFVNLYEDPSLAETFKRITLLRTTPLDVFDL